MNAPCLCPVPMVSSAMLFRKHHPVIALLTDFGTTDTFVGVMKGVIAGISPKAHCVDLTHGIAPQDVYGASLSLSRAWEYFPPGTVFCAVVDPGVGTKRAAIGIHAGGRFGIGPDNGTFSHILQRYPDAVVHSLSKKKYRLPDVSSSFHGRDVFAPAAAHLAGGISLRKLGGRVESWVRLSIPCPAVSSGSVRGVVDDIDHFGNCITNISRKDLNRSGIDPQRAVVRIGSRSISPISQTYAQGAPGELLAHFSGSGCLEISVNGASAAKLLSVSARNEEVELELVQV